MTTYYLALRKSDSSAPHLYFTELNPQFLTTDVADAKTFSSASDAVTFSQYCGGAEKIYASPLYDEDDKINVVQQDTYIKVNS